MASKARRQSTRIQDDKQRVVEDDRQTRSIRRQSMMNNASSTMDDQKQIMDNVTRRKSMMSSATSTTPSISKIAGIQHKKKLKQNEIENQLQSEDDEDEAPNSRLRGVGKSQNNISSNLAMDDHSITIKIKRLSDQKTYKIVNALGMIEKNQKPANNKDKAAETPRELRQRRDMNLNENFLMNEHQAQSVRNIEAMHTKSPKKPTTQKDVTKRTNTPSVRRSVQPTKICASVEEDEHECDSKKNENENKRNLRHSKIGSLNEDHLMNRQLDQHGQEKHGTPRKATKQKDIANIHNTPSRKRSVQSTYICESVDEDEHECDSKKNGNENKRNLRHSKIGSLNEDHLMNRQLNQHGQEKHGTPRKATKQNDIANIYNTPRRKGSVQSTYIRESVEEDEHEWNNEDDEGDENKMHNANSNLSPKRLRSVSTQKQTPMYSHRTPSKSSARSSKVSVNTPIKNMAKMSLSFTPKKANAKVSTPLREINLRTMNASERSTYQSSKSISSRKRTATNTSDDEFVADPDSESCDDGDDSVCLSDEDESDDSISSSDEYHSPKRQKVIKQNLNTPKKTPSKNTMKTPSKSAKKISMDTPTKAFSRMSLKNSLTPSMHQRTANIVKPSTPLQEARHKLHVSALPKSLPCREEQFNDIYTFLHARLSDNSGGCIYISGVPGTGKTATVNEVIRCLKKSMAAGKLTEFKFIDINGMKLSEPRQAYVQIWKQLTGRSTTWEEAQKMLQNRFAKPDSKRGMTLLLVDELDLLCTKRQDVVYNLLDWPSKTGAKLVVVTIANTMDLPERILMGKVTSRLGLTRLTFPPYNHKQLEEIVVSRLRGHNAFSGETIQLVARKVAAVSGDARRALDICRRATEIAENNKREMVSMVDVKRAVDEMIASPKIQAIKHCSDLERVFLEAVCSEVHRTGVEEVVFKNVFFQLETLCRFNGEKVPNVTEALSMCSRLGSWRLLLCDHSRMDVHQRILLNVSTDDVHFAIQSIET